MKHTPGPWLVGHGNVIMNDAAARPMRICNVVKNEDSTANARLIASSPDLLDACLEFIACGPNAGHNAELIKMVKAAITKATTGEY